MAEVLAIIGGVASLISLSKETAKACNNLARFVRLFKNASSDISDFSDELFDLSHTIELVYAMIQTLQDQSLLDEVATIGIEKTLTSLRKDFCAIEQVFVAIERQSNLKAISKVSSSGHRKERTSPRQCPRSVERTRSYIQN